MDKQREVITEIKETAHKVWLAGLGALAVAEEEGGKVFRQLVERGKEFETRGREQLDKVADRVQEGMGTMRAEAESLWGKLSATIDERVKRAIHRRGMASQEEVEELRRRVEELTRKLEEIERG